MPRFAVCDSTVEVRVVIYIIGMRVDVVRVVMLYTESGYKNVQRE